MTVGQALRLAADRLRAAGIETAELDAELLLRHLLGWERARLLTSGGEELPEAVRARFDARVEERTARRPLQHLTGVQSFWRHVFRVSPHVLIPRPETELLVEEALGLLRDLKAPVVVDVGTGSGCIAVSLAAERPDAEVHATDLSAEALAVARENAEAIVPGRVQLHHGDLLEAVPELAGRLDLVVSNPPYVGDEERPGLQPEVLQHEPAVALFPPGARILVYERLIPQAARWLRPGGALAVEIGHGMASSVGAVCEAAGLEVRRVTPDLHGIPRVVVAITR